MFRILGFLIGSATSIAVILLVMGMPEFHAKDSVDDQQRFDAAVEKLMAKQQDVESVADEPDQIPVPDDQSTVVNAEPLVEESPQESELLPADPDAAVMAETDYASAGFREPAVLQESQWYSFWNPFRSEIAASGFVAQLERVTGIDYRVVKIKPGVYEVAFAYGDDAERHAKLVQISAATGLDLPDS
jgi:hypothetical protein